MFEINKACRATIYHNLQGKKLKLQTKYIHKHIALKQCYKSRNEPYVGSTYGLCRTEEKKYRVNLCFDQAAFFSLLYLSRQHHFYLPTIESLIFLLTLSGYVQRSRSCLTRY